MGVPIKTLICASNDNKVLYDFFTTGTYDRKREFILTNSPSMDILISSNLERLIYLSTGCDAAADAALMKDLSEKGSYTCLLYTSCAGKTGYEDNTCEHLVTVFACVVGMAMSLVFYVLDRFKPVSYTHLDVYKRQDEGDPEILS